MSTKVAKEILERLTRVDMPKLRRNRKPEGIVTTRGRELPLYRADALVIGSGAAGLRAAIELKRRGVDVLVITTSPFGGTSACSGSDKQTLHTACTAAHGDDFLALVDALAAGGAMDLDSAYVEAVGSISALAGLQYLGLPLPQDRFGAVLRYQTDHDEVGRATSCGPRTSRLMVRVLAEEALRLGVHFLPRCEAIRLLESNGSCSGVVLIDHRQREQHHGMAVAMASNVILATGGPGELYRDSVYPHHCYGSLGMAIEAGIVACNLTESQFGIGTPRHDFPWNLSGTYAQAMPYVFSVAPDGRERNFLARWYRTTREIASSIFRKGYQWPFHATRMLDFGSSLVDVAVAEEQRRGHLVVMDFQRNPAPGADGEPFALGGLDQDVRSYLENNRGMQGSPIERLQHMNPLAVELFRMHRRELEHEPLPFGVNNQHMNGGIAVDTWFRTSMPGCFAIGEVAGTHGATRPGGAALNAGQVGGQRVAEYISRQATPRAPPPSTADPSLNQIASALQRADRARERGFDMHSIRSEIQNRMSDRAGFLCDIAALPGALDDARRLREEVDARGIRATPFRNVAPAFRWWHLALTSEAVLASLCAYVRAGGGSRGARAYLDPAGQAVPVDLNGPIERLRFREERSRDRDHKLTVRFDGKAMQVREEHVRRFEDVGSIFFERHWPAHLNSELISDGYVHR